MKDTALTYILMMKQKNIMEIIKYRIDLLEIVIAQLSQINFYLIYAICWL